MHKCIYQQNFYIYYLLPQCFQKRPLLPNAYCPNLLSVALINHWPPSREGTHGRNLEAGTEAESIRERCLLACSPWPARLPSLYNSGPLHRSGTTHGRLAFPRQSLIQKRPHRPVWWKQFLNWDFFFPNNSGFCQIHPKRKTSPSHSYFLYVCRCVWGVLCIWTL